MGNSKSIFSRARSIARVVQNYLDDHTLTGSTPAFRTVEGNLAHIDRSLATIRTYADGFSAHYSGLVLYRGRFVATTKDVWNDVQERGAQVDVQVGAHTYTVPAPEISYRSHWHTATLTLPRDVNPYAPKIVLMKKAPVEHLDAVYVRGPHRDPAKQIAFVLKPTLSQSDLDQPLFSIDASIADCDKGAAVTDARGNTIGIVIARTEHPWNPREGYAIAARLDGAVQCVKYRLKKMRAQQALDDS